MVERESERGKIRKIEMIERKGETERWGRENDIGRKKDRDDREKRRNRESGEEKRHM